jgi:CelD/BcsL family acetyltransferase involved in cellulose biosynthesis
VRTSKIPIEDPKWRDFTLSNPSASPFHLPAWASLIAACYRFDASALAVCDNDGEILGGVPVVAVHLPFGRLRWVSLPFSDYCPVLTRPGVDVEDIVRALDEHVRLSPSGGLEIRSALPAVDGLYPVEVGYHHVLELPKDSADLHPHRNYRQQRNQAMKRGVRVTRGNAVEDVEAFYALQTLTRRRLGVPVQPRRLFELISNRMFTDGHGFVATATLGDEVLAACLYLTHNGTMVAKYAASDPGRPETGAAHLIHWEVMSAACAEGYHTYDLGRTDLGADGLRTYKTRMGADERPLVYTHIARTAPSNKRSSVGGLAQSVIRSSPTWVCRAVGEVLYRWTA